MTSNPALSTGRVAVVTGAAMGIGLAISKKLAAMGMKVAMADVLEADLAAAKEEMAAAGAQVVAASLDVTDLDALVALRRTVHNELGPVSMLVNNAVTRTGGDVWSEAEDWRTAMEVNFWGVLNGVRAFLPAMLEHGKSGIVVNVGSKQGITNPPGNLAYNVTKSALKTYTEGLQHELRNIAGCRVSAHLLVPGWTTTGRNAHKPGAWLPEQVAERMVESLQAGDFYIVCPDDEATPEMDRQRILWAARDITENRPLLSRWHPDFKQAFEDEAGS